MLTRKSPLAGKIESAFGVQTYCAKVRMEFRQRWPVYFFGFFVLTLLAPGLFAQEAVTVRVDASAEQGPLPQVWRYFGYDEPNFTYTQNGRQLIGELVSLSRNTVYLRTHNLLTTGDGTPALKWGSTNAYTEDASGQPVYNWTILDRIFDTYLHAGAKPYVEIGFMPEALSTHPEPYQHHWPNGPLDTGWSYPPNNYAKWSELVRHWVEHCVERYGKAEVESWDWEVWNEPDIFYWHGTPEEYDKLYDFTANAVKSALPSAKVGGPASTGAANAHAEMFLRQFLEHCARGKNFATGKTGAPLDFISFHAKGAAKVVDGHLEMGIAHQLLDARRGFDVVRSFPQFAGLPVVLSEFDPEGCAACAVSDKYPQAAYRNNALYAAYTAAAMNGIEVLAQEDHIHLQAALTWAFQFEGEPYFAGRRSLATHGIDKPILNLFRMYGLMRGAQVEADSDGMISADTMAQAGVRGNPDLGAMAARSQHGVTVLVWNYADDDVPETATPVKVDIAGLPKDAGKVLMQHFRIDQDHSNAFTAWQQMGSPQNPTPEQYARLKSAGQLQLLESPSWVESKNGTLELKFSLPREAVSLLKLSR